MSNVKSARLCVLDSVPQCFKLLKSLVFFILLFLFFILAFFFNLLQMLNYLLFEQAHPSLRRQINSHLQDIVLTSFLFIFEFHCNVSFTLHFDTVETQTTFGQKNGLLIVNHSQQLDAFFYWQCCQMLDSLGSIKAFTRASLKWIPIVGWMLWFNESIFLQQKWRKDERNIRRALDRLKRNTDPYFLAFAPEGTRFTLDRYCDSQAFCEEFQIPVHLKHHLLPRVKGFTTIMQHMLAKSKDNFSVYNAEFVCQIDEHFSEPTLRNFLSGKAFKVNCYLEKIPYNSLPSLNVPNSEYTKFLYNLFERKDQLVEEFKKNEQFSQNEIVQVKGQTFMQFVKFLIFNVLLSGFIVSLFVSLALLTSGHLTKLVIFAFFVVVIMTMKSTLKMLRD